MRKFSKLLLRVSGFYYLVISVGLLLSTIFSILADRKYIFAIFDMLGFSNISISLIKPLFFILLLCLFIVISLVSRKIFKSIKDKDHFLSIMFIGFFFLFLDLGLIIFLRDKIILIPIFFNLLLILGSMLALREKSKIYYKDKDLENIEENKISNDKIEKDFTIKVEENTSNDSNAESKEKINESLTSEDVRINKEDEKESKE